LLKTFNLALILKKQQVLHSAQRYDDDENVSFSDLFEKNYLH
jgi:hypothetical protein